MTVSLHGSAPSGTAGDARATTTAVGIIGAGPGGLIAAATLREVGYTVTVFEARGDIGGVWNRGGKPPVPHAAMMSSNLSSISQGMPEAKKDIDYSPMYGGLRTNLPTTVMQIPGFNFEEGEGKFVSYAAVQNYLLRYAASRGIKDCIHLGRRVTEVRRLSSSSGGRWELTIDDKETFNFDNVVVANGPFNRPFVPLLLRPLAAAGRCIHSCQFDDPADFDGRRVLVVGGSHSGQDAAGFIARRGRARAVYWAPSRDPAKLAHWRKVMADPNRRPPQDVSSLKIHVIPAIRDATIVPSSSSSPGVGGGAVRVVCVDGSTTVDGIDIVICATGYLLGFPFSPRGDLAGEIAGVRVCPGDGKRVEGLANLLVAADDPSIAFVGLGRAVAPFHLLQAQALYLGALWRGRIQPPTRSSSTASSEPQPNPLVLGPKQWAYGNELRSAAGGPPLDPLVPAMYQAAHELRLSAPLGTFQDYRLVPVAGVQHCSVKAGEDNPVVVFRFGDFAAVLPSRSAAAARVASSKL